MLHATRMKIYLAGPISGHTGHQVLARYAEKSAILSDLGYQILQPMVGKEYLDNQPDLKPNGYELLPISTQHAIFARDHWMVQQADILLVDFSNADRVSIGSCMEMAWAAHMGKQVILVMGDHNPNDHAFVIEAATIRFSTLDEAYDYLKTLAQSMEWDEERHGNMPILSDIEE